MIPPGGFRIIKSIKKRKRKGRKVDTGFRIDLPDLPQVARVAFTPPPPTVRIKAPPRYLIRPPAPVAEPLGDPVDGWSMQGPVLCDIAPRIELAPFRVEGITLPPVFCHPIVEPPSQAIYPGLTLPPVFCEVMLPVEPPSPIYGSTIYPILCDMGPTFPQPQTFVELQLPPVGGVPPSPPPKIYPGLTLPPIKC